MWELQNAKRKMHLAIALFERPDGLNVHFGDIGKSVAFDKNYRESMFLAYVAGEVLAHEE